MICIMKNGLKKISTRKKNDEPLHCARLGNVWIRSSTSISLKETGSVCVWQKRAGLTTTGRTQRGQFWVSGIGLVPLQWWWFLVRSSFLPTLADDWHCQPPQCYQRHDSNLAADLLRANQQTQTNDFRPTPRLPHKFQILVFDNESWLLRARRRRSVLSSRLYHDII